MHLILSVRGGKSKEEETRQGEGELKGDKETKGERGGPILFESVPTPCCGGAGVGLGVARKTNGEWGGRDCKLKNENCKLKIGRKEDRAGPARDGWPPQPDPPVQLRVSSSPLLAYGAPWPSRLRPDRRSQAVSGDLRSR
jgi:hypothetical protein